MQFIILSVILVFFCKDYLIIILFFFKIVWLGFEQMNSLSASVEICINGAKTFIDENSLRCTVKTTHSCMLFILVIFMRTNLTQI